MRGSPRPRAGYVALAAAITVLAACGSKSSSPHRCATSAECPADTRCVASACVANAPPIAEVALPEGPLVANVLLSFDASSSHDPDADDAIASYAWTFRAGPETPCAAPVVAGTQPVATVRFGCAGHYEGDLTVMDQLGAVATKTFSVDALDYSGVAMVTAGPDVAVSHRCTSLPTRCTATRDVQLSAATQGLAADGVTFRWSVEPPPDRPLDANRRVRFTPGDDVASPLVSIETDGQAISGDWVFRVEVRDAAGVIGAAATRVSVGNEPPIVTKIIDIPQHGFASGLFTASGEVPFTISDPDGDAFVGPSVEWRHAGDGDGTFAGELRSNPSRVTFSISVPYTIRADAQHLIGGAGLERTIVFTFSDVNGAQATETWPIVVGNREPSVVSSSVPATVDHWYDAAASAYRAAAAHSTWLDPDGDPLFAQSSSTGDSACTEFTFAEGTGERVASVQCALAFQGYPAALASFVGAHVVSLDVRDPWRPAGSPRTTVVTIANRPPGFVSRPPDVVRGSCSTAGWCDAEGVQRMYRADAVTTSAASRWTDPDGDPLSIQATGGTGVTPEPTLVCTPSTCSFRVGLSAISALCGNVFRTFSTYATDGLASVAGNVSLERVCE
jgi:hypothetical protein